LHTTINSDIIIAIEFSKALKLISLAAMKVEAASEKSSAPNNGHMRQATIMCL